jgi:two-component system, NarL family, response regulator LiaR
MSEQKISVLVVDDHAVVRSGLGAFISAYPDLELAGEADSGVLAVRRCQQLLPDVVLMDLKMPGMDGVAATRQIREQFPQIQVIALTSFQEDELVQRALQAGAIGYLMKNVSAAELAAAIRAARLGQMTLSPEAAQALINASNLPADLDQLTEREREVLKFMVEGLNNADIARRMVISLSTVKYHVSNILMKLGVDNRVAAVTLALQRRLV